MNCVICTNPFAEGDKKTESLCGCIYHSSCSHRILTEYIETWQTQPLSCPSCLTVIFQNPILVRNNRNTNDTTTIQLDELYKNSIFKNDLKDIKKKYKLLSKATNAFKKYVTPKKNEFKTAVSSCTNIIRELRKNFLNDIKQDTLYKDNSKLFTSYRLSLNRFCNKYDITNNNLRLLKIPKIRYNRLSPQRVLEHLFRKYIRLRC